ncbi:hypothetical protein BDW74DRAFT_32473 [Aspergillus multicolor]|uniref:uncharacterized protein n=1 Tax=Aspergillus multicolor TaxID=41759 RepID=UPI003CCD5F4F
MPSYVVTGASRGLGFELVRQLAADPSNTVIGLVRNRAAADAKAQAQGLTSVHFVEAQYTDLDSLKAAAETVKAITGGTLNYLINNAAFIAEATEYKTLGDFNENFPTLESDLQTSFTTNVIGVIKTITAFLPLIEAVPTAPKKVIAITSGMSDLNLINDSGMAIAAPYAISKGALNVAVAKYSARYKKDGILFMGVCPGYTATERVSQEVADEDKEAVEAMGEAVARYAPGFKGIISPGESVTAVLALVHKASVENGDGGAFVSRFGDKKWF